MQPKPKLHCTCSSIMLPFKLFVMSEDQGLTQRNWWLTYWNSSSPQANTRRLISKTDTSKGLPRIVEMLMFHQSQGWDNAIKSQIQIYFDYQIKCKYRKFLRHQIQIQTCQIQLHVGLPGYSINIVIVVDFMGAVSQLKAMCCIIGIFKQLANWMEIGLCMIMS